MHSIEECIGMHSNSSAKNVGRKGCSESLIYKRGQELVIRTLVFLSIWEVKIWLRLISLDSNDVHQLHNALVLLAP